MIICDFSVSILKENSSEKKENELINEKLREIRNDEETRRQNEKQDRIEASIKQREEAVRAAKEEIEKDRKKERGVHLHDKAVENFMALLTDMVRNS